MASHNTLGKMGEEMAVAWLTSQGYEILHRNWRHAHLEVDIIAQKNNTLHLIEVKARRGQAFGFPEEGVSLKKIENLLQAGDEFQVQYPEWRRLQYDVLSILITSARVEYFLIEDVYL